MSDTLRLDGVSTELEVWEGRWHGWHLSACHVPEGEQAIDKIGAFIRSQLEEAAESPVPHGVASWWAGNFPTKKMEQQ